MSFEITDVIVSVKTKSEITELLRELDLLEESLYKTDESLFENTLENCVNIKLANVIKENMDNTKEEQNGIEYKKKIIEGIKNYIESFEVVRLEIAVEPTSGMIKKIHQWVVDNIGKKNVIYITVDKEIIAGAKVTYKGEFGDFSLKKKWDEVWDKVKNKSDISNIGS